jgi:hypothetical protein
MLLRLKWEGRGTDLKSQILAVAPHKLQSSTGDLMLHPISLMRIFPFPFSFLTDAEHEF